MSKQINRNIRRNVVSSPVAIQDRTLTAQVQERIVSLINRRGGNWSGSMTELMAALRGVGRAVPNFPTSPSVMRRVVNGAVYGLRRNGVRVAFGRETDSMRKRYVNFATR